MNRRGPFSDAYVLELVAHLADTEANRKNRDGDRTAAATYRLAAGHLMAMRDELIGSRCSDNTPREATG